MSRKQLPTRAAAVTILTAVLLLGVVQIASGEQTIALSTGTVELALPAGGSAADKIAVANNGDEPLKAKIYTNDVEYDSAGMPEYVMPTGDASEYIKSPASWLSLRLPAETQVIANVPYIELAPGEEMILDFEMQVPPNAPPGDYNAIIFFEMFDDTGASGTSSKVSGRLGARIMVRVAGDVIEKLEVAPFWVRGFIIGDVVPYEFTFSNEGNVDERYVPELVVLDRSEKEIMRSQLEESAVVYAGNARVYSGGLELEKPLIGQYTLRTEMTYEAQGGSSGVVEKDRTFWIVPLWLAVVVLLVLSLPILYLVWRSSVKADKKKRAVRTEEAAE